MLLVFERGMLCHNTFVAKHVAQTITSAWKGDVACMSGAETEHYQRGENHAQARYEWILRALTDTNVAFFLDASRAPRGVDVWLFTVAVRFAWDAHTKWDSLRLEWNVPKIIDFSEEHEAASEAVLSNPRELYLHLETIQREAVRSI